MIPSSLQEQKTVHTRPIPRTSESTEHIPSDVLSCSRLTGAIDDSVCFTRKNADNADLDMFA